jgi:miniconductance mechanosensitive channel
MEAKSMSEQKELAALLAESLGLEGHFFLIVVTLVALLSFVVARLLLVPFINRAIERTRTKWDDIFVERGVFAYLAFLAPVLVFYFGVGGYPAISELARQVILAGLVVNVVIIIDRLLSAVLQIYRLHPISRMRPIKGYIQFSKLVLYVMGAVTTVAVLLNKSPWGLLGGVGALTAILILVFRDTLLSIIASIQIAANDLVRRGDWIEVPESGADGDVIDIALHTIKVKNWDNTIITVPTSRLISGSFRNWRGMYESGGLRIKRSLLIDQTSVCFCNDTQIQRFWRIDLLRPYLEAKGQELDGLTVADDDPLPLNRYALTNLGVFRAYVSAYLNKHSKLRNDMPVMVRQRPPSPHGLPLEIYVFSGDTVWANYESIQSDIFDHFLAAVRFFDLRVFQHPTGFDLQMLKQPDVEQVLQPKIRDILADAKGTDIMRSKMRRLDEESDQVQPEAKRGPRG